MQDSMKSVLLLCFALLFLQSVVAQTREREYFVPENENSLTKDMYSCYILNRNGVN